MQRVRLAEELIEIHRYSHRLTLSVGLGAEHGRSCDRCRIVEPCADQASRGGQLCRAHGALSRLLTAPCMLAVRRKSSGMWSTKRKFSRGLGGQTLSGRNPAASQLSGTSAQPL